MTTGTTTEVTLRGAGSLTAASIKGKALRRYARSIEATIVSRDQLLLPGAATWPEHRLGRVLLVRHLRSGAGRRRRYEAVCRCAQCSSQD